MLSKCDFAHAKFVRINFYLKMSFLKWKTRESSDSEGDRDIQTLTSEIEASTYLADKRNASKELVVSAKYSLIIHRAQFGKIRYLGQNSVYQ